MINVSIVTLAYGKKVLFKIDRRMGLFDEYLEKSDGERMKVNLAIAC
jgi:hypothetical protein